MVDLPANWRLYSRARDGFGALLDTLKENDSSLTVILPAYIGWSSREGSGVHDPVRERSLNQRFYPLRKDLTIDIPVLKTLMEQSPEGSLLLLIHYFGRPDPGMSAIVPLARERGFTIVEDAAHAFFSAEYAHDCGRSGDAVLYSVHKMFPVPEGGILKLNKPELAEAIPAGGEGQAGSPAWLPVLSEDWTEHAMTRLKNYALIREGLRDLEPQIAPFWADLPGETVPQSFPLWVAGNAARDRLYFGLKEDGFAAASLYHTLIAPLTETDAYPVSLDLSRHLLNLPLGASISPSEILRMCATVRLLLTEKGST